MRQAGDVDLLWMLLAVAVCVGLFYVGYRIEPHHVSKDGTRFLCTGQWITSRRRYRTVADARSGSA